ncbi:MAG: ATP-binding protein, partial [Candidatus Binatia bacterium]
HVFLNVMQNAVQQMAATPNKGGTLSISTACRDGKTGRRVQIRFQDTGPGIHKRLWEKVFSLGFSTRQGGTGLGLFIARSLVESLGGRILVEQSVIPIGTTFLVELPAALSPEKGVTP